MARTLVASHKVSPDGTEVRFVLDVSPYAIPTFQQKKIAVIGGHPRIFKQAKVKKAEKAITMAMSPFANLFDSWGDSPRSVSIDFLYEYPTSTPKRDLIDYRYSIHKNDLDNSNKGFQDSLTEAGFWKDDALIAELHLRKFRTITKPRIILTIKKLKSTLNYSETDLFGEEPESFFPSEHQTSSDKDL
jgi:Holliday junction resolvase RusA-like endonuclease